MKLLHTSDWHVGKTVRGRSRIDEHRAVLAEIVMVARQECVDLVMVVGDLFETASPTAEAEELVYRTLLELADTGAHVAVVAGNHDNARRLEAVAPVFAAAARIHVVCRPTRPDEGGVWTLDAGGMTAQVAMLPFVSQRGIVRARDLMDAAAYENAQAYADRIRLVIDALTAGFSSDSVNIVMAHGFVIGGALGGGERAAHFIEDYALSAQVFPVSAGYVALGHVHQAQSIAGAAPIRYCGSPLMLDFGDASDHKQINIVELEPGLPAVVRSVTLRHGRAMRTISGTMSELESTRFDLDGLDGGESTRPWLRVFVDEPARAGLNDEVRSLLGDTVVEVRAGGPDRASADPARARRSRRDRSAVELFTEYLSERNIDDDRLVRRFTDLLDRELDASGDVTPG